MRRRVRESALKCAKCRWLGNARTFCFPTVLVQIKRPAPSRAADSALLRFTVTVEASNIDCKIYTVSITTQALQCDPYTAGLVPLVLQTDG